MVTPFCRISRRSGRGEGPREMVRAASAFEPPLEPERVPDREHLPVVVEVGEHLDLPAPALEAPSPLLELTLGVVAATTARAVVEADERPIGRELVRLERLDLGPVSDHERRSVTAEKGVDVLHEPARMAELEAVALVRPREPLERGREPVVVPA